MTFFTWLAIFIGTTVVAYFLVWLMIRWTSQFEILDVPCDRSSHDVAKPVGGGLAIAILTLAAGVFAVLFTDGWQRVGAVLFAAGLISGISAWDDLRSLPRSIRLAAHAFGATVAMYVFGYWDVLALPYLEPVHIGLLGIPITFVWIVGITNAYNFMDGIDGLAGSQAVIAGLCWAIIGAVINSDVLTMLGLVAAAASLGFLLHNWAPARIFMGDVGSTFLGYLYAVMPVAAAWGVSDFLVLTGQSQGPATMELASLMPVAGLLILWPFLFDTGFTLLRRLKNGENVLKSHRQHLYQRLVVAGSSHGTVTLIYIGLALVFAAVALGWLTQAALLPLIVLVTLPLLSIGLWRFVTYAESSTEASLTR